ncbi:MAG: hypothetical protein WC421_06730 [Elusimicrobiales bacterium]
MPITLEERMDALAEAFAEGFIYLAEHDLLGEFADNMLPEAGSQNP